MNNEYKKRYSKYKSKYNKLKNNIIVNKIFEENFKKNVHNKNNIKKTYDISNIINNSDTKYKLKDKHNLLNKELFKLNKLLVSLINNYYSNNKSDNIIYGGQKINIKDINENIGKK